MNVTLGLPRLIEIVDARRIPSTPSMTIYLTEKYRKDENKVRELIKNQEPSIFRKRMLPLLQGKNKFF